MNTNRGPDERPSRALEMTVSARRNQLRSASVHVFYPIHRYMPLRVLSRQRPLGSFQPVSHLRKHSVPVLEYKSINNTIVCYRNSGSRYYNYEWSTHIVRLTELWLACGQVWFFRNQERSALTPLRVSNGGIWVSKNGCPKPRRADTVLCSPNRGLRTISP